MILVTKLNGFKYDVKEIYLNRLVIFYIFSF